ncbi:MAG: hypothetical protein ACI89J_003653 [Hyphomicrobiaceae bacterium]|jgi:hypothetical protein
MLLWFFLSRLFLANAHACDGACEGAAQRVGSHRMRSLYVLRFKQDTLCLLFAESSWQSVNCRYSAAAG